ncbi:MAG TPA: cation:proton antiporter [Marmoricola sp.]|nr:cation:proton antiporter [Marmoricola sp.]
MTADFVFLITGGALLLAVVLPNLLSKHAISAPMVLLVVGMLIGLLPMPEGVSASPIRNRAFVEHLTELTVIVALMGVGLAIDRPLSLRSLDAWRRWGATWRLLVVAMPLCVVGVAFLGWWVMGLAPAAAVLLGAVLAPTDPVLASDVQVGGPTTGEELDQGEIDEDQEVRFALTSEAGLNDGLAFPFVYFAIFLVTMGGFTEWGLHWFAWEVVGKIVVGVALGVATGWVLAKLAFASAPSVRLAEIGEPLLALAGVLLSYGLAEAVGGGYGFLAVFACAMTLRSAERGHNYHEHMHESIERLERLLTLIVLLLLGVALTDSLVAELTWKGALVGLALVFVVRPLCGLLALRVGSGRDRIGDNYLTVPEQGAAAFFGVRGVGSLYYLAYAAGEAEFEHLEQLWATVAFTIAASVLVHGIAATPVMARLEKVEA